MGGNLKVIGIAVLMLFIVSISTISRLLTDYWWFSALDLSQIFLISLKTKAAMFLLCAIAFFLFGLVNLYISKERRQHISFGFITLILLVLSIFIGMSFSSQWLVVQEYINRTPFNIADPVFGKDAGFYVFTLPFYNVVWLFLFITILLTLFLVILNYIQSFFKSFRQPADGSLSFDIIKAFKDVKRKAYVHAGILSACIFLLLAIRHYLAKYYIMYKDSGIVVGAGYTDVMIYIQILKVMIFLAVLSSMVVLYWAARKGSFSKAHMVTGILLIYAIFGFLGPVVIPGVFQALKVSPNELNLERPYLENNIRFTRIAYGLDDVEVKDFPVSQNINQRVISESRATIDNVRILDWRPLTKTYKQTQEIRLYYDLSDIDIDRYVIDGKITQVMLSGRELDQNKIAGNAKTWVNLHMIYTHGYGVVMSPVNRVNSQGLPDYLIKDIPPVYTIPDESIRVDRPQIYYGNKENKFVLVNTDTPEFDYPKGNTNEYIRYDGKGGVTLDSFFKKLMMAIRFADVKILLSSDVTDESKIMFDRAIRDRVGKITPFITLDQDPYLVIHEGGLYWILDGYTTTGNFPYSKKYGPINYIRNSVKVVINAYDGEVTYYITDLSDPLIATYAKIFPSQFKMIDSMPDGLREHVRYPEDLFKVQIAIYSDYHMDDVTVFYNKEDAWQIPYEIYGVSQKVVVEPYYLILRLPEEEKEEFVLMMTFTPIRKDNMVAWMAARSDGEHYGKLIVYKFPKDKLVYGPLQVEARFDQDSAISQQLTLWSQQGSQVTRGNLLAIPINDSILYVEPLYLQADSGQLPELKRILMSDGERVVMEETLEKALASLIRGQVVQKEDRDIPGIISDIKEYYHMVLKSAGELKWTDFGENLENLGKSIDDLQSTFVE